MDSVVAVLPGALVAGACAAAFAAIALMNAKAVTIAWTSAAGASLAVRGVLWAAPGALPAPVTAVALFALAFAAGAILQVRSNAATEPAPSRPVSPASPADRASPRPASPSA